MTKDEKLEALTKWQAAIEKADRVFDPIVDAIGLEPDGALFELVTDLQIEMTEITSFAVGDTEQWLDWYWLENDMGNKGMEAGYDGNLKKIRFLDELLELIEQDQSTDTK